jgi:hypothetical protein
VNLDQSTLALSVVLGVVAMGIAAGAVLSGAWLAAIGWAVGAGLVFRGVDKLTR